jgi:outer membrane receptor protein involved in Fe transport
MARHQGLTAFVAALAAMVLHAPASAATSPPTAVSEVVVTAQKKAESLENVPISVKAVTSETIETLNAESAEDYLRLVPSVSMTNLARGGNQIQIRGLGSNVGNVGTVAVYNDGVVAPNRIQQSGTFSEEDPGLFDIDRVEVLRGPQGTLYGEGSLGGVINIISKLPNLDRIQAEVSGTWFNRAHGTSDNEDVSAMVNLPIIKDVFGVRLVGYSYDHDGWISLVDPIPVLFGFGPAKLLKTDANTEKVTGGRAIAAFKPNETFDATFIIKGERTAAGAAPFASPHQIAFANALGGTSFDPAYTQTAFLANSSVSKTTQAILQLNAHTGIGDLTSLTGYGTLNSDSSTTAINHDRAWDEELRLASRSSGAFSWIVGAYYRNALSALDLAGVGPFARDKSTEEAIFGQAYWAFAPGWKATVGLRESHQTSEVNQVSPALASRGTFNSFLPKVTVQYQHDPNAPLFYVTAAKGFRAGGANVDESEGTDPKFRGPFSPDSIWNYELGSKATFLGGKLTVNAAVFYIDWSNVQIDRPIISLINPPVGFIVVNGSRAHSYGVEADVYLYPTPQWTITLGGSALNAGFDSGVITGVQGTVPLKGETFSSTPKYTANLSVERRIELTHRLEGYLRGDYSYRSSSFGDVPNHQFDAPFVGALGVPGDLRSGASQIVNLRAGIRRDQWDVQVFCTNVFDTHASTFTDFDGGFTDLVVVLPPRTIGVNLKLRYN